MDLDKLRVGIDEIDDQLTGLFAKRMEISAKIARYKDENNLAILNKSRERVVLNRVTGQAPEDMATYLRILYNTIFDLSRSYQNRFITRDGEFAAKVQSALENTPKLFPQRGIIACQGVEGAYSQIACDKLFTLPRIMYFRHFDGVFQAVEQGLCQYGLLPIENSSYGSVGRVYDLMRNYHFYIVRSIKLRVHHVLLAPPGVERGDIREVFSHEQAIGQCSAFLKGLKNVKITVCENTAEAAKMVADSGRRDAAAISSHNCALLYGLNVLSEDIQNSDNNYTRFICIAKELEIYPGANKISLMLSTSHEPGSLYTLISRFAALGLNLTKLESRPIPGRDFEFVFYFDMEASLYSAEVIDLLAELQRGPELFEFLGNYSEVV